MDRNQRFLEGILSTGLESGLVRPEDIFEHISPDMLAKFLPVKLKAKLLAACLNSAQVTPNFLLDVVGLEALVLHAPMQRLWNCVADCMERSLEEGTDVAAPKSMAAPRKKSPSSGSPRSERPTVRPGERPPSRPSDGAVVVVDAAADALVVEEVDASQNLDMTHRGFGEASQGSTTAPGLDGDEHEITVEISGDPADVVTAHGVSDEPPKPR